MTDQEKADRFHSHMLASRRRIVALLPAFRAELDELLSSPPETLAAMIQGATVKQRLMLAQLALNTLAEATAGVYDAEPTLMSTSAVAGPPPPA
jgi:hypothetical protein